MENIFMVTIPGNHFNARKVCDTIEFQSFKNFNDLINVLYSELSIKEGDENQPQFLSLTDFMDKCNDQYLDLDGVYISYVKIESLTTKKELEFKEYSYSVSTETIWSSIDCGNVFAESLEEAREKAVREVEYNLEKINDVLAQSENTKGFTISIDLTQLTVKEV